MDDKKKLAIVGVLAAIVVGIGAFQFMGGGSKGAPPKVVVPVKQDTAAAPEAKKIANPEFAQKLPERDPFKASGDVAPAELPQTTPKAPQPPQPGRLKGDVPGGNSTVLPMPGDRPLIVAPPEPVFNYRLAGLILGRHPAAVFMDTADKSGSQRLIPIGGSIDGDTQLISITKGLAVVSFRGKKLRLTLGGTPDAN